MSFQNLDCYHTLWREFTGAQIAAGDIDLDALNDPQLRGREPRWLHAINTDLVTLTLVVRTPVIIPPGTSFLLTIPITTEHPWVLKQWKLDALIASGTTNSTELRVFVGYDLP
jgi:hypothetical protein